MPQYCNYLDPQTHLFYIPCKKIPCKNPKTICGVNGHALQHVGMYHQVRSYLEDYNPEKKCIHYCSNLRISDSLSRGHNYPTDLLRQPVFERHFQPL